MSSDEQCDAGGVLGSKQAEQCRTSAVTEQSSAIHQQSSGSADSLQCKQSPEEAACRVGTLNVTSRPTFLCMIEHIPKDIDVLCVQEHKADDEHWNVLRDKAAKGGGGNRMESPAK